MVMPIPVDELASEKALMLTYSVGAEMGLETEGEDRTWDHQFKLKRVQVCAERRAKGRESAKHFL